MEFAHGAHVYKYSRLGSGVIDVKLKFRNIASALALTLLPVIGVSSASANVSDRVVLQIPQKIISKQLPSAPGVTKILLATNTPYVIKSEGAIGELSLTFTSQGTIDGRSFGTHSQVPTQHTGCVYVDQPWSTSLFTSEYRTASGSGRPLDQAIIIEVTHDPMIAPQLTIEAADLAAVRVTPLECS